MRSWSKAAFLATVVAGLTACGGGGGGGGAPIFGLPVTPEVPAEPEVKVEDPSDVYMLYGANGSRQSLAIDFDKLRYVLTDRDGKRDEGTLTPPTTPGGDYGVVSSRSTGNATSAVRKLDDDTIVGALPLAEGYPDPVAYASFPFVATRALLEAQADLDGLYNRFRVDVSSAGRQSSMGQVRISGGGTVLEQCADFQIFTLDTCPQNSLLTSTVAADDASGIWTLSQVGTTTLQGRIGIATIGGEKVYLSAGPANGYQLFAIGLPSTPTYEFFSASTGWSTRGTFDNSSSTGLAYELGTKNPAGTANFALNLLAVPGVVSGSASPHNYFFTRSSQLEIIIGARDDPAQGYFHLGVIDQPLN